MRKINNITIVLVIFLLLSVSVNIVFIYYYYNEISISSLSNIADWATAIVAFLGFVFAYFKLRKSNRISESSFLIKLRNSFSKHRKVHRNLEEGGKWHKDGANKSIKKREWVRVYAYIGLFELCNMMLDKGLIDMDIFSSQYRYRIENILNNESIVQKIIDDKEYWKEFIQLTKKMKGIHNPLHSIEF